MHTYWPPMPPSLFISDEGDAFGRGQSTISVFTWRKNLFIKDDKNCSYILWNMNINFKKLCGKVKRTASKEAVAWWYSHNFKPNVSGDSFQQSGWNGFTGSHSADRRRQAMPARLAFLMEPGPRLRFLMNAGLRRAARFHKLSNWTRPPGQIFQYSSVARLFFTSCRFHKNFLLPFFPMRHANHPPPAC